MYKSADALLWSDQAVVKADTEYKIYTSKLADKGKKIDEFKHQLWTTRLEIAQTELKQAKKDLKKNLDLAKYNKIWDTLLWI